TMQGKSKETGRRCSSRRLLLKADYLNRFEIFPNLDYDNSADE
ncbi:hypothetical protein Y032_0753g2068, partial [Ancylostoma ceylanicum]